MDISDNNWDGVAYSAGNLVGGFAVGAGGGGRYVADHVGSSKSTVPNSWNPFADTAWKYQSGMGSKLEWLATAPTPASGGTSATLAATGMASSAEIYKYFK